MAKDEPKPRLKVGVNKKDITEAIERMNGAIKDTYKAISEYKKDLAKKRRYLNKLKINREQNDKEIKCVQREISGIKTELSKKGHYLRNVKTYRDYFNEALRSFDDRPKEK